MLLKKRIVVICCLIVLVQAAWTYADCSSQISEITSTKVFTSYLKQSLFEFLSNPDSADDVSFDELNATLHFYVSQTNDIDSSLICQQSTASNIGNYNNVNLSVVIGKMISLPQKNTFPRCPADGTLYGDCSKNQPFFCYSGKLVPMCAGPDMDYSETDDNCGCPAGQDPCNEETGYCNVLCYYSNDCTTQYPAYTTCVGEMLRTDSFDTECINNYCQAGTPHAYYRNCTKEGKVCSNTAQDCVACSSDSDCPKLYTGQYECYSTYQIKAIYNNSICKNPGMVDSYCKQGTGTSYDYSYRTCNPSTEKCVTGGGSTACNKCYPKSTPAYRFSTTGGGPVYYLNLEINTTPEMDGAPSFPYNFTSVTIYEYKNGVQKGHYNYDLKHVSCQPDCPVITWSRDNNAGTWEYNATLHDSSGTTWHLPNDPSDWGSSEFCFGNYIVAVGGSGD